MQRNFEPMRKQVEVWQKCELTDVTAKVVIYEAFVEGKLEAPKHLARTVHDLYFEPKYEVPAADDLESVERLHVCIQGTGAYPAIQGDSKARRVPRESVLAVVLGMRRYRPDRRASLLTFWLAGILGSRRFPNEFPEARFPRTNSPNGTRSIQ